MTGKQRFFVEFYVGEARGYPTQAARLAGYSCAKNEAYRLMNRPDIWEAIQARLRERTLSADEVLHLLTQHARGDLQTFLRVVGDTFTLDLTTEAARANLHLIKKVRLKRRTGGRPGEEWEETEMEIELHDPQDALGHLGRHHAIFTDRQELAG